MLGGVGMAGLLVCMVDGHCRQAVRGMRGCRLARMLCGLVAGLADSPASRLSAWRSLLGDGMLRLSGSVAPCLRGVG